MNPHQAPPLDNAVLAELPGGDLHLAYIQQRIGYSVKMDMPHLRGPHVEAPYQRGASWLAGVLWCGETRRATATAARAA
jgi:hypothetical protein